MNSSCLVLIPCRVGRATNLVLVQCEDPYQFYSISIPVIFKFYSVLFILAWLMMLRHHYISWQSKSDKSKLIDCLARWLANWLVNWLVQWLAHTAQASKLINLLKSYEKVVRKLFRPFAKANKPFHLFPALAYCEIACWHSAGSAVRLVT